MEKLITVGMRRRDWIDVLGEALYQAENNANVTAPFEFTIYAKNNIGGADVTIQFDNDDMERDDVKPKECYVEITDS